MGNSILRKIVIVTGVLWILAFLASLVVLEFPGIKGFYWVTSLNPGMLTQRGSAYDFSFANPARLFDPESLLITENGKVLTRTFSNDSRYEQVGVFLNDSTEIAFQGSFTPSVKNQAETITSSFEALARLKLISGLNAGRVALFLLFGLLGLSIVIISNMTSQGKAAGSNKVSSRLVESFSIKRIDTNQSTRPPWKIIFLKSLTIFLAGCTVLILSEWLFFSTRSSFMDSLSWPNRVLILLASLALFDAIILVVFIIFQFIGYLISKFLPTLGFYLAQIPFSLLCACLIMILVDNFTYSIFLAGIAGTTSLVRLILAMTFCLIIWFILNRSVAAVSSESGMGGFSPWLIGLLGVLIISIITAGINLKPEEPIPPLQTASMTTGKLPNILLISSDGIDADHFSVYGYERDTTPFLREIGKDSLIGENHFSNSGHTLGTFASVLTGRSPLATRVLFSPDILRGSGRYLHLPGILQDAGYRTVSFGIPFYADANTTNFRDAFQEVNCLQNESPFLLGGRITNLFGDEFYLLDQIEQRVLDRVKHIFFISVFSSPIWFVNESSGYLSSDRERIKCLNSYLEESAATEKPFFAQIHLLGTHGPRFEITVPRFSRGKNQEEDWMTDFYDDTILNFDLQLSSLVSKLKSLGIYEDTMIVIYSDHGKSWSSTNRIPLIIHFPRDEYAGVISQNSQNLDIAPTILDYLGFDIPGWMDGDSLLNALDPYRPIFSLEPVIPIQETGLWMTPSNTKENQYQQFGAVQAIICQKILTLNLESQVVSESLVEGYTQPCSRPRELSRDEIIDQINEFLLHCGFPALPNPHE